MSHSIKLDLEQFWVDAKKRAMDTELDLSDYMYNWMEQKIGAQPRLRISEGTIILTFDTLEQAAMFKLLWI